ncbi:MAG TPA: wax ester/triacylglycerol synthase family O-acyltransferase [Thermoanaerobaculia bacterium]|nr:wax ester/triacylglycerol synthase family O-acyltransferase [Thermoanaerobaculia bacterium]
MAVADELPHPASQPPAPDEPLSSVDYAWLRMDEPTNLMMINGVLVLETPADMGRLRTVIEERLLPIPRFRQRVVLPGGGGQPRWEIDPEFDLDNHLVRVRLPDPGDEAGLREVIDGLMSTPLDPERPLWQFHLIDNFAGGSVLLGRLHHCIGDGLALLMVLLSLTDRTAETPHGAGANPFTSILCERGRDLHGLAHAKELVEEMMPDGLRLMLSPVEALKKTNPLLTGAGAASALGRLIGRLPDPKTAFKGPLGVPKKVAWSEALRVDDVKAVGRGLGGTVNDVLLSAMTGGLRRYLEGRGERTAGINVRAAMPVNLRPLEKMAHLGNQFGLIFLSLPVGIADPVERLAELGRRARALKRSAEPVVVYAILSALGKVPLAVQKLVVKIFAAKTTAVMTNVPGPRQALYLAGRRIRDLFFWVPQSGRVGIGISIFSYDGHVRLGVGTDAGLVPDPQRIVEAFHDEFVELQRRAGTR